VNKTPVTRFRTHNIAIARNFCLQYVRDNKNYFPYFIMMDMDNVNCKNLNLEPLQMMLKREIGMDYLSIVIHIIMIYGHYLFGLIVLVIIIFYITISIMV
jgi:hypothetical protein